MYSHADGTGVAPTADTPLEVDIYAHANSTNALGSRMLNGIGGSADFLRNAKLSVMHTPSSCVSLHRNHFHLESARLTDASSLSLSPAGDQVRPTRPVSLASFRSRLTLTRVSPSALLLGRASRLLTFVLFHFPAEHDLDVGFCAALGLHSPTAHAPANTLCTLQVIVTEQGLADVRGLSPRQRALVIIEKCAHPDYREQLKE